MKIPHCSALYRYWLNCANHLPHGEVVGAKQANTSLISVCFSVPTTNIMANSNSVKKELISSYSM